MKKLLFASLILLPTLIESRDCSGGGCCGSKPKPKPKENPVSKITTQEKNEKPNASTKEIIQEAYTTVVRESGMFCQGGGCCGGGADLSQAIGYTQKELEMFADANLGLGCGHPVSLGYIKDGDVVLDLGSGAGLDCFLAYDKVGEAVLVIGVDMTKDMIKKARENAHKYNINNVEFRLGDIENLPVAANTVDVVMSNCVINLAPDKKQVFNEVHRVLKPGGMMAISDVVLLKELSETQKNDSRLLCACVSGALLKEDYLAMLAQAGFSVTIIDEDLEINKKWFDSDDLPISSLKFIAYKK